MSTSKLIQEAMEVLHDFEVGKDQLNERSAMTLLALLQLKDGDSWEQATNPMLGTRAIMDWIRDEFGVNYKPNTRETIRRFTLHQFIMAGIIEENADQPYRPTNSPKWNYRVTNAALEVFRGRGMVSFPTAVEQFLEQHVPYASLAEERRNMPKTPVMLPDGAMLALSPGGQSELIRSMIEEMLPRFAPGCQVVYVDDTNHQMGALDADFMRNLGILLKTHDKAPDVIAWDSKREWLFLMEAASSHGPVDVTRKTELHNLFANQWDKVVLVSCFPDRKTMQKYLAQLAWETEAWCADSPDHMLHLNGSRFMGPYGE